MYLSGNEFIYPINIVIFTYLFRTLVNVYSYVNITSMCCVPYIVRLGKDTQNQLICTTFTYY